ncbi:MAG: hypothetical protein QOJ86_4162 [Bradyrhizobium sp.]|jgi:hypothetical protein|nr:hypothetical protein [Bradyrhizobium sp.]
MSTKSLDIGTITKAFGMMGRYLRERHTVGEIAVYGGSAILLQFPWRKATEDVDAVFREPEAAVKDAAAYAAAKLGLPDEWLNDAVGGFTAETEPDGFFLFYGDYPKGGEMGLRVFLAKPEYLCAMKLKAVSRSSYDDKDFNDLVELAIAAGITSETALRDLFSSFFPGEKIDPVAAARIPEAVGAVQARMKP